MSLLLYASLLAAPPASADLEVHQAYRPQLDTILNRAATALDAGEKADADRLAISCAMAKNGNFSGSASLNESIKTLSARVAGWSCLGRAQGKFWRDHQGAKMSFEKAVQAARQISSGESDLGSALTSIAADWAASGDLVSAQLLAHQAPASSRFTTFERVARIAARAGDFRPAQDLLHLAGDDEERSRANALISIGHAVAGNPRPALEALARVNRPEHKVIALLALYDAEILDDTAHAGLLPQALALVSQIKSDGIMDYSVMIRDQDLGAIALAQLENEDEAAAVAAAMQTLARVEDASNAQAEIERICEIFAGEKHLNEALEIAALPSLPDYVRLAAYDAILRALGEDWSRAEGTAADAVNVDIARVIELAIEVINGMSGNHRLWAIAGFVESVARTRNYDLAEDIITKLEEPRQRVYAFGGLALASMEQRYHAKAESSLAQMLEAAGNGPEFAGILAQSVRYLLDDLQEDHPTSLSKAFAGLH